MLGVPPPVLSISKNCGNQMDTRNVEYGANARYMNLAKRILRKLPLKITAHPSRKLYVYMENARNMNIMPYEENSKIVETQFLKRKRKGVDSRITSIVDEGTSYIFVDEKLRNAVDINVYNRRENRPEASYLRRLGYN